MGGRLLVAERARREGRTLTAVTLRDTAIRVIDTGRKASLYIQEVSGHRSAQDRVFLTTICTDLADALADVRRLAIAYGVPAEELP